MNTLTEHDLQIIAERQLPVFERGLNRPSLA
jgi:hypothetical protein